MKSSRDKARAVHGGGLKQWIKSIVFFCLYYSGVEWLLARLIRVDGVAVLMYHGVCDHAPIPEHINFHLKRDVFERQMRLLKRRYRVIPLQEVVEALKRGAKLEKAVALTFDDGYKNNALYAAPLLQKLGLPFTVFVATSFVETGNWMPLNEIYWLWSVGQLNSEEMNRMRAQLRGRPSEERAVITGAAQNRCPAAVTTAAEESFAMLSWDEIRGMARAGAEFGSHTHSHCNMAAESGSHQREELLISKQLLEDRLKQPIKTFAYPYGRAEHMSETARHNIMSAGYECAVSGEYGLATSRSDRFRLPRLGNDRRRWMFAGEILYQFARQAAKDAVARRTRHSQERHG